MYPFLRAEKTGKQYEVPRLLKKESNLELTRSGTESHQKFYQKLFSRKMEGGEAPEKVKRANAVRYLE